ncbi:type VI secretion system protein ImpA [Humitalea rosea]|uniref:Type VI secretion system protein ImpA n=1 Tax=Humitalea rosea TaxID=990373 RepID=A0A2W7IXT0_9PROT|nr:type VI secretion system protein TssA [Humitalea rosea]PZW51005.1 type VI secretion system protein ImpA [Humitalea rosea]
MADEVIDVATMLAPLAGNDGAGEDLRQDYSPASPYQKLRDARAEARAEERARDSQGDTEAPPADGWRAVRRIGTEVLLEKSKDFEIAAWLTEALVRQDGLPGLAAGARLLAGLLETFWDPGFPQPDEDGLEGRGSPLGGLAGGDSDGTVMQALRRMPLFRRPSGESLGLYQYEAALDTAGLADEARREQRYSQGVLVLETVETEAKFDRPGLRATVLAAEAARAAWQAFQDQLDARFGYDAPPSRRVAEVLDRLREVAETLAGGPAEVPVEEMAAAAPGAEPVAGGGVPASGGGFGVPAGNIAGREQALKVLEQVASYFQKSEPHSFLAYTLNDAVRRGRMTLPELLAEVLQDETARTGMLTALGIRPGGLDPVEE